MSENTCSHENCYNEVYQDTNECILHCDKSNFDDNDVNEFWEKLRQTFIIDYQHHYNRTYNEVLIEDVLFPKFQYISGYERNLNFNNSNGNFQENVRFKNCTFFDNFDLTYNQFRKSLQFDDCIFYDDINVKDVEKLILENCEFKNEFKLENTTCKSLEIKKTTFQNTINILVYNDIKIDNNSLFHDKVVFNGLADLEIDCKSSKFDKEIIISSAKTIKLFDLEVNGNIECSENIEKLEIIDSITGILELRNVKEFLVNNLTSHKLTSIGEKCENVLIENSNIDDINLNAIHYEHITLQNDTKSKEININDAKNVIISDSSLNDIKMLGKNYTSLSIRNTNISNLFEANSIRDILFDNVKMNPKIVLNENNYPNILLKDSSIGSLLVSPDMFETDGIKGKNGLIQIETTTILNECKISKVNDIKILNSNINGLFNLYTCLSLFEIVNSQFKGFVDFKESKFTKIEMENIVCEDSVSFESTQIDNLTIRGLNDESNKFSSLVDFSKIIIKTIHIDSSLFEDELKFNDVSSINLSSISRNTINKLTICNTRVDDVFKDSKSLVIDTLSLDNVKLYSTDERLTIDLENIEINDFKCNKLCILNEVNFDEMKINHFAIANSNIEKILRIKYTDISKIEFTDTIFEDLQIINNEDKKSQIEFNNTTIKSILLDKLYLEKFDMNDAHVSDAKIGFVNFKKGTRETNRFFKNYYDSIRDYITADKYYRNEMEEQLKDSKGVDCFLLFFNKIFSNFGQCWWLPIVWIIAFTLIFYRITNFDLLSLSGFRENHISWMMNDILKFSNPFSKKTEIDYGMFYWAWFLHKLLMTIFIYHFVVAIKRKTKR